MSNAVRCLTMNLIAAVALGTPAAVAEVTPTLTRVGNPVWEPVDFVIFSSPGILGAEEFNRLFADVFPRPNHIDYVAPEVFLGPDAPHLPPYRTEASEGLARLGLGSRDVFSVEEFAGAPEGGTVVMPFLLVPRPDAPNGPSPDFANGPVIPGAAFPITWATAVLRDGATFIVEPTIVVPSLDAIGVATDSGGDTRDFTGLNWSHLPLIVGTDLRFGPPGIDPIGDYAFTGSLRDAGGNGWDYSVPFRVVAAVPEPPALALAGLGLVGLIALALGGAKGRGPDDRRAAGASVGRRLASSVSQDP